MGVLGRVKSREGTRLVVDVVVPTGAWETDGGEVKTLLMTIERDRECIAAKGNAATDTGVPWGRCSIETMGNVKLESGARIELSIIPSANPASSLFEPVPALGF